MRTKHRTPLPHGAGRRDVRLKKLIWEILMDAPNKEMQLQMLYMEMQQRHAHLATRQSDWRGTVRHILSAGPYFRRVRDSDRRGCWRINDDYVNLSSAEAAKQQPHPQQKMKGEPEEHECTIWTSVASFELFDTPLISYDPTPPKVRSYSQPNVSLHLTPIVPTNRQEETPVKTRSNSEPNVSYATKNPEMLMNTPLSSVSTSLQSYPYQNSDALTTMYDTQFSTLDARMLAELVSTADCHQFQLQRQQIQVQNPFSLQFPPCSLPQHESSSMQSAVHDVVSNKTPLFVDLGFSDATISPTSRPESDYFTRMLGCDVAGANVNLLPSNKGGGCWPTLHPFVHGEIDLKSMLALPQ